MIASQGAGGISDIFIRVVGDELHKKLGGQPWWWRTAPARQVNIGARACADAPPDGYTFCILPAESLHIQSAHVFKIADYDPSRSLSRSRCCSS